MKEIRVSFDVSIALRQRDVHWVEEELLRIREEVFLGVLKRVLEEIEGEELRVSRECEACGLGMVRNGQALRKIKTLLGVVELERVRLRCPRCGQEVYPLDEGIGLEIGESVTLGVKERSLWAAVEVSYEKAHEFLEKFTGLEVSRKKIHAMALEEGERIGRWEEERRKRVFEEGGGVEAGGPERAPEVLYVQVDGTAVNGRGAGEWMECKVGASFSERMKVSKDRFWLRDKKSYASIEGIEAFGEKFFLECVRQGVLKAKEVIFIGDGAHWIRTLKEGYFPEAIGVLDIWHLEKELRWALGEENQSLVEELKGLAFQGKGSEIVRRLMGEAARAGETERRKKILEAMIYVRNNLDWIGNIPRVKGYGSGPVEKTVDITVARRLKKRGMSWHRSGANPLLKLRLLKLNGEWESYWAQRRREVARYAA
jgi:Zn finger protein HypA/HybF involved in hydrogenase expression